MWLRSYAGNRFRNVTLSLFRACSGVIELLLLRHTCTRRVGSRVGLAERQHASNPSARSRLGRDDTT